MSRTTSFCYLPAMKNASQNQIKNWTALSRGKERKKQQAFLAEGLRSVQQILQNGFVEVRAILIREDAVEALSEEFSDSAEKLFAVGKDDFNSIADTETPQPVMGICRIPEQADISEMIAAKGNLLYLDRIQDPGNMGTIYRTASWFGLAGIVLAKGCADLYQPKVVRSTAGATGSIPVFFDEDGQVPFICRESGMEVIATVLSENSKPVNSVEKSGKKLVMIGNEANGIRAEFLGAGFSHVHIPGRSEAGVESLNAAVTAGIVMHALYG